MCREDRHLTRAHQRFAVQRLKPIAGPAGEILELVHAIYANTAFQLFSNITDIQELIQPPIEGINPILRGPSTYPGGSSIPH
ncbi:hypothetical protein PM082_020732 [Marasmius tenuissimus]|nr:hypothetical protein PM082_020732 [Marasmius tenuissimus]